MVPIIYEHIVANATKKIKNPHINYWKLKKIDETMEKYVKRYKKRTISGSNRIIFNLFIY